MKSFSSTRLCRYSFSCIIYYWLFTLYLFGFGFGITFIFFCRLISCRFYFFNLNPFYSYDGHNDQYNQRAKHEIEISQKLKPALQYHQALS